MAQIANDTFTDSDKALESHTSDSGDTWAAVDASMAIDTNEADEDESGKALFEFEVGPSNANYKCACDLIYDGTTGKAAEIGCRWNGLTQSSADAYFIQARDNGQELDKIVAGTVTRNLESSDDAPITGTNAVSVEAEGTTLRAFWKGSQMGSDHTDTAISATGNPGIGTNFRGNRDSGNGNWTWDNLVITDFVAAGIEIFRRRLGKY